MGGTAAVISAVIGAYSAKEAHDTKKEAKKDRKEETAEQVRRDLAGQKKTQGLVRAKIAASGAATSGSMATYLEELEKEHGREIAWTRKAGKSSAKAAGAEASQAAAKAISSGIGAAGKGYEYGQQKEWWG